MPERTRSFRLGVAGPVGTGKTSLIASVCAELAGELRLGVVTNDIYTDEDARYLRRAGVLARSGSGPSRPERARTRPSATT
jgi:urease accessory protein